MTAETDVEMPALQIFKRDSRRDLIRFALKDADLTKAYNKKELADKVSYSNKAIDRNFRSEDGDPMTLVDFGIFEPNDPNANIVLYQVALTPIVELLRQPPARMENLLHIFSSPARRRITEYFVFTSEFGRAYSINELRKSSKASFDGIREHVDILVTEEIIEEVPGKRGPDFRVRESEIVEFLFELNEAIFNRMGLD